MRPRLLIVPMLAFDRDGNRIGYGAGFYDRTLLHLRRTGEATAIGIAYAGQEVEHLPVGPHDERLDWNRDRAGDAGVRVRASAALPSLQVIPEIAARRRRRPRWMARVAAAAHGLARCASCLVE